MVALLKTTQIQEPSSATVNIGLDSSGNVGIGTITPATLLELSANTSTSSNTLRFTDVDTAAAANQQIGKLEFYSNDASAPGASVKAYMGVFATDTTPDVYMSFATDMNTGAPIERMRIDASGYMQGTVNGLSAGRIPAMQYYRLNSDLAGANATGAQNVFGVGVTLVGSTQYAFESVVLLSKSAGTTSHTIGMGFGGTATINNVLYYLSSQDQTAAGVVGTAGSATTGVFLSTINTVTNTTFTQAITTAARFVSYTLKGTISINAGGTFIPQYTLSAAPGGAYSTVAGSYFAIYPLAASGSNVSIGSWA